MFVFLAAALALSPQRAHHHHARPHKPAKAVDETAAIRVLGHKVQRAFETKDMSLLRSTCTSNFQTEMPDHKVYNLKQSLAMLRKQLAPMSEIKAQVNMQQTKVNGNTAMVDDRFTLKGKMADKKGKHNVVVDGSETISLKKVRGQWLAYYDKMHDQSVSVDGHVVSHMP